MRKTIERILPVVPLVIAGAIALAGCSTSKPKYNTYPDPTRWEQVVAYCRDVYATQNKAYWDCLKQNDPSKYKKNDVLRENRKERKHRA